MNALVDEVGVGERAGDSNGEGCARVDEAGPWGDGAPGSRDGLIGGVFGAPMSAVEQAMGFACIPCGAAKAVAIGQERAGDGLVGGDGQGNAARGVDEGAPWSNVARILDAPRAGAVAW